MILPGQARIVVAPLPTNPSRDVTLKIPMSVWIFLYLEIKHAMLHLTRNVKNIFFTLRVNKGHISPYCKKIK